MEAVNREKEGTVLRTGGGRDPEERKNHCLMIPLLITETCVLSRYGHTDDTVSGLHSLMPALISSDIFEMLKWYKLLMAKTNFQKKKILIFIEISHYIMGVMLSIFFLALSGI